MDKQKSRKPENGDKRRRTFTAASGSGASVSGQTLLRMLIGGLILIVVGMLVVVLIV